MSDDELLKVLIRALGWRVETLADGRYRAYNIENGRQAVFGSSDKAYVELGYLIRPMLHSVDAALALPWPKDLELYMEIHRDYTRATLMSIDGYTVVYAQNAPTLARALCEVFAQWWKEAHHEETAE